MESHKLRSLSFNGLLVTKEKMFLHIILHILGLDNSNSMWYLWWSGFGADLGELTVIVIIWRHFNCHEPRCKGLARHQYDGFCRKHVKPRL
jgi:hypothetical protein